jgi:hypothetical protein
MAAFTMLVWTWDTWPDVLIDFGRERYIPWRLAEGEVLYRDVAVFNGPLSQYFNALGFRLFGASLHTLVFCNLTLLALFIVLLYYALRQVSRRWVATTACLIFVLLFAFAEQMIGGNFNYVCPYGHEMTHGLMLSLLAVVAAWPSDRRRLFWVIISGLALGLSFLTKAEVFLPGLVAAPIALLLGLWFERPGWRQGLARLGCFFAAFLIPPLISFLGLACAMSAEQALFGTLGSWGATLRLDITTSPFHRMGTGLDYPLANALKMLSVAGFYALILVPAALLGLRLRRPGQPRMVIAAAVFAVVASLLWYVRPAVNWADIARPFPVFVALTILVVGADLLRCGHEEATRRRCLEQITLLVFALTLLVKMVLFARIWQYGFVLAMPATLLLSVVALDWVPAFIDRRGGHGEVFAAAAAALISVIAMVYLDEQARIIGLKTRQVGSGADAFWADARGTCINAALAEIVSRSSRETTLVVLPEGAMLNCLSGRRNSTPYCNLLPVETMIFGEDRIIKSFQAHPPNLILLVPRDVSEFGYSSFGQDYSQRLYDWINANYRPLWHLESASFQLLEKQGPSANVGEKIGRR